MKYVINGGNKLFGRLSVDAAKNACLPIIASTIMCDEECVIKDIPMYLDVIEMTAILEKLGKTISFENGNLVISGSINSTSVIMAETKTLRSSIFMMGSILSKYRKAILTYPGGCDIGKRPIDIHLAGLKKLGIKFTFANDLIYCDASKVFGNVVELTFPSVGATENIMMASTLLDGEVTVIKNCAREPEIVDLANFINSMGGKVFGAGYETIVICGVKKLHKTEYRCIGDRIACGTYLIAGAMCGGRIELDGIDPNFLMPLVVFLRNSGCNIDLFSDKITLENFSRPKSIEKIETEPYPGFPTDLQSPMLVMQTISKGISIVHETVFEARFKVVSELVKMGAKVSVSERYATVVGVAKLRPAQVTCPDLRGGAGLVLAGLVAKGKSEIDEIFHIERGYFNFDENLKVLGASINKID
jgi:UDP-N-acetylglucosamine 1-carboxyvinyltransferase